jgi:hypothetical protein
MHTTGIPTFFNLVKNLTSLNGDQELKPKERLRETNKRREEKWRKI